MHSQQQHHTRRWEKSTDDDLPEEQQKQQKQIRSGGGDDGASGRCNRTSASRRQQGKRKRQAPTIGGECRHLSRTAHKRVGQLRCSGSNCGAGGGRHRLPLAPVQSTTAVYPHPNRTSATSRSLAAAVVQPPISDEVIACDSSQSSPESSTASSSFSYASSSRQIFFSSSSSTPLHNSPLAAPADPECCAALESCDQSEAGVRALSQDPSSSLPSQSLHASSPRSHANELPSTVHSMAPSNTYEIACQLENAKLSSSCEIDARSDSASTPLVASFAWTNHHYHHHHHHHHHHQPHQQQQTTVTSSWSNLSCRCCVRGHCSSSANTTNCELTTFASSSSSSPSVSSSPSDGQFAKMYQRVCCSSEGHQHQSEPQLLVDEAFPSTSLDSISSDSSVLAVPVVATHVHNTELQHCGGSSSSSSNNNNNSSSVDKSMSIKEEQQEEEEGKSDETKEDLNSICKYLPTSDQTATTEPAAAVAAESTRPLSSQATSSTRRHFQNGGLFEEHHNGQRCLPPARYQIYSSPLPSLPSLLKTEAAAAANAYCNDRETDTYKSSPCSPVLAAIQRWTGLLFFVVLLCLLPPSADASANIRAIEKKILDRIIGEGYDSRIRPMGNASTGVRGGDGPAVVNVNLLIRSISKIDDVIMEYSVQLTFRQTWIDSRLKFDDMNGQIRYLVLTEPGKVWRPDLFFKNEKEGHFHNIILPNVLLRIHPNGDVLYSIRISLVLACPMDLKYYPLDKQVCQIEMASYGYTTEDLMFLWKEISPVQITTDLHLPRFTLEKYLTDYCTSTTNTGSYSCLRVSLLFKREFSYYLIQIYIPCCMLVIVSWVSFWLDPNAIPARVSLGVTTLLTMATSISGINSSLPPVSYTKAIDVWTGVCLTFVFGALLEFALVNYASRSDAHRAALKQQQAAFAAQRKWDLEQHAAAMEADHIDERGSAFAMRPLVRHREFGNHGEKMRTCEIHVSLPKRNWCKRWLSKFPTRSKRIDVISRIFFPLMFALFNLVYWTTYLFREDMQNLDKNKQ